MKQLFFLGLLLLTAGCVQTTTGPNMTAQKWATLDAGYNAGCRDRTCQRGSQAGAEVRNGQESLTIQTWSGSGTPPPKGLFDRRYHPQQTRVIVINKQHQRKPGRVYNGHRQIRSPYGGWCYSYKNSHGQEVCL